MCLLLFISDDIVVRSAIYMLHHFRHRWSLGGIRAALTPVFTLQSRSYYKANDGVLPRRESRRTLAKTRRALSKESSVNSRIVLLPPFISPGEVRVLLGVDYKSALGLCQVKMYQQKYYWSDLEGRCFETANKRKVLVPYDMVSASVKLFGLSPIKVDPEPLTPVVSESGRIPAVAILGSVPSHSLAYGECVSCERPERSPEFNLSKWTALPLRSNTSRALKGRTLANADLVLVVSEDPDSDLVEMVDPKKVAYVDPSIDGLDTFIAAHLRSAVASPMSALVCEEALKMKNEPKRTDVLVDCDKAPIASAVILDVEKSIQQGTTALILVKRGSIVLGQNFVAGSGFGKVTNIWSVDDAPLKVATPGMVVKVGKLVKNEEYTGDFAPDDYLFVFPRERAWRLAFHRQRIEWLNSFQTDGKKLEIPFELDAANENQRSDAAQLEPENVRAEQAVRWGHDLDDFRKIWERRRFKTLSETNGSILVEPVTDEEALAAKESAKVVGRWSRREEQRAKAKQEQMEQETVERREMYRLRKLIHGHEVKEVDSREVEPKPVKEELGDPLPESRPVIAIIVKTGSVSTFDSVMDELELLEREHGIKLPIVHGGIGPVTPNDLVHAEIESRYSPCPVYTLGTSVLPQCTSEDSQVVKFDSVEDLIADVKLRLRAVKRKSSRNQYTAHLRRKFSQP